MVQLGPIEPASAGRAKTPAQLLVLLGYDSTAMPVIASQQ